MKHKRLTGKFRWLCSGLLGFSLGPFGLRLLSGLGRSTQLQVELLQLPWVLWGRTMGVVQVTGCSKWLVLGLQRNSHCHPRRHDGIILRMFILQIPYRGCHKQLLCIVKILSLHLLTFVSEELLLPQKDSQGICCEGCATAATPEVTTSATCTSRCCWLNAAILASACIFARSS